MTNYLDELFKNPKCELEYSKDYEFLIAVMLSAQTTDKKVNLITKVLFSKYNTLELLSNAKIEDIIKIIKPLGLYNRKSFNIIEISKKILEMGGFVPNDREFLNSLPGVSRKTINVVLGELFDENVVAVDTHVKRVSDRLGISNSLDYLLETEIIISKYCNYEMLHKSNLKI